MPAKKLNFDYLVASDCGNSTGVSLGIKKDRCILQMQPFSVARRQYSPLTLAGMSEQQRTLPYYTFEGANYTIGLDTAQYRYGNPTERDTNNTARYGSPYHQFFTAISIHRLGIKAGKIALTVFMPPVPYMDTEKREKVKQAFLDHGKLSMAYTDANGDTEGLEYHYIDVNVLPEGAAAIYGMVLDQNGQPNKKGVALIKSGYVAVVDLGSFTGDSLLLRNGQIDETSLKGSTIAGLGVHNLIRKPLMDEYGVTNEVIDNAVIQFVKNDCQTSTPVVIQTDDGRHFDIADDIDRLRRQYFQAVAGSIFNERFNGMDGIKGCILVGGGSMVIQDLLTDAYGAISLGNHIAEPFAINAESGLRKAMQDHGISPIDC